jgi:hypothetical protein
MTVQAFEDQMQRLAGLRFPPADLTTHWEALRDMPVEALAAAVSHAQKTRVDFPTPVELRRDADTVRVRVPIPEDDRFVPLETPVAFSVPTLADGTKLKALVVDREWKYYCDACHDTGRESVWCGGGKYQPWLPDVQCESSACRRIRVGHPEYGHELVRPCSCAEYNPEIKRRKEAQGVRYAQDQDKASR